MEAQNADDPDLPLLARVAEGDQDACRLLVERHLRRVHATATRLLGDAAEADDVAQDVFVAAWQAAAGWKPGRARFGSWLLRVTLNACHDRHRRRRRQEPDALQHLASDAPGPEQRVARGQRAARVDAALQALPPRQREALVLCHYEGCSQQEAAALLEVSEEALESLLARGRRRLREWLIEERGE